MAPPARYIIDPDSPNVGQRLDAFLVTVTARSRAFVQQQIERGHVRMNGEPGRASKRLRAGDDIEARLDEPEPPTEIAAVAGDLVVLHEDESFLALNKAQGVVVHPAGGTHGPTLVHYLLHHLQGDPDFLSLSPSRPGIVHRLDRGTSGLILVAKTREAQEALSLQFKKRLIKKEYEAVVWGRTPLEGGRFDSVIGRDRTNRKKMSSRTDQGRPSLTYWKKEVAFRHFTHVSLFPHTGRTHQLRVHLTEAGFPIVGDDLYGVGSAERRLALLPTGLQPVLKQATQTFLHARKLTLTHPVTGAPMELTASRPKNFEILLAKLKEHDA